MAEDQYATDGDFIVIVAGIRYRREDAVTRGIIEPERGASTDDGAEKDARIAELEAKLAELEAATAAGSDQGSGDDKNEAKEEQAAAGKTRPAPPNKARPATAK